MAELDINLDGIEAPAPVSDVIPPGTYKAEVVQADYGPTSKGGMMMTLEWCIIEGSYKNRRVWDRQNLKNASADTERYAKQALIAMSAAMGMPPAKATELLLNKPVMIKVAVVPEKNGYSPSNAVKGYSKTEGSRPSASTPSFGGGGQTSAAPIQAAVAPTESVRRPWQKAV